MDLIFAGEKDLEGHRRAPCETHIAGGRNGRARGAGREGPTASGAGRKEREAGGGGLTLGDWDWAVMLKNSESEALTSSDHWALLERRRSRR